MNQKIKYKSFENFRILIYYNQSYRIPKEKISKQKHIIENNAKICSDKQFNYFAISVKYNSMRIIVLLGSPNSDKGVLSQMAKSRVKVCVSLYEKERTGIVLTGGFGAHFNTTEKPHAYYLKQMLVRHGIPEMAIFGLVESKHSVEDATLSKWIIEEFKPEEIVIVTSDYHEQRARIIFEAVYAPFSNLSFISASSKNVDPEILQPLTAHEKMAVKDLLENGVRF